MAEYEFSNKPHRMTSPPANNQRWLEGYDGTKVRLETDPTRIAILCREATWGSVYDFDITPEIMESTLKEIQGGKVLGAALETPALAFVCRGSRATMDQLLRLRESAGASHTTRDNDFRDFNIIVPNQIAELRYSHDDRDPEIWQEVWDHIERSRELYGILVDRGVPPQDARYVALPMGYQGDWVQVMNVRALVKECEQRLCNGLTQHESNWMVRLQRDLVVAEWPWMDAMLRSSCEKRGRCASSTMLFPPCGAFGDGADLPKMRGKRYSEDEEAMTLAQDAYDAEPERYLYPPQANDAMQFAQWDRERVALEREFPGLRISFSKPPERDEKAVAEWHASRPWNDPALERGHRGT